MIVYSVNVSVPSVNVSVPSKKELKKLLTSNPSDAPQDFNFSHSNGMEHNKMPLKDAPQAFNFSYSNGMEHDKMPLKDVKRCIEKQEVVKALSQEKACFANYGYGSTYVIMRFNDEVFEFFLEQLANNTITTHLTLHCHRLSAQQTIGLMQLLQNNTTLQSLTLIPSTTPESTESMAMMLKVNTGLQKLDLPFFGIGNECAIALAEALESNTSLHELNLSSNDEITEEVLPHFCYALKINKTLKTLNIYSDNIESYVDAEYLRKPECEYNTLLPHGIGIKNAYSKPPAKNISASTEETQDDGGDKHELEGSPLEEQQAAGSAFDFNAFEEALPQTDGHQVTAAGDVSDLE